MPKKKRKVTNIGGVKTVGPVGQSERDKAQAAQMQHDINSGLLTPPSPVLKKRRQRRR